MSRAFFSLMRKTSEGRPCVGGSSSAFGYGAGRVAGEGFQALGFSVCYAIAMFINIYIYIYIDR